MKKLLLCLLGPCLVASAAFAGVGYSGKEIKQVAPPPCPEWYADREFNISLWGTYVFTGEEWINDKYIEADHAWGGGIDLKYFFMRYIGVGIEGWAASANQARQTTFIDFSDNIFQQSIHRESNVIGAVLGTLTLRYPIPCTRFAPYIFGGGGAIFGGGQRPKNVTVVEPGEPFDFEVQTKGFTSSETEAIGQVGGGMEIRLTPHIGWVSDFSWNFIDGPNNNFGMVRTGVNFAF
jgi:Outer membrane protein beta-barrel domain